MWKTKTGYPKSYYEKTRERRQEASREYTKEHPEYRKEQKRINKDRTAELDRATQRRRRARRYGVGCGRYSDNDVIDKYGNICGLCGDPIDLSLGGVDPRRFTVEHLIPISRGGDDVIENVRPAHLGGNNRKHTKTIAEYIEYLKRIGITPREACNGE